MRHAVTAGVGVVIFVLGLLVGSLCTGKSSVPAETPAAERTAVQPEEPRRPATTTPAASEKAQPQPEGFSLVPAKYDYGKMLEGEARTTSLRLERPEGAVRLGRLYSPCPCIRVSAGKLAVEAGEDIPVQVHLHSLTLEGKKSFPVYVELLEPKQGVLRADVDADVARVPAKMLVRPQTLHLGAGRGAKTATVRLFNLTKRPIRLESVACSIEGVEVSVPEGLYMEPGAASTVRASVPESGLPAGPVRGVVTVETNCPEHAVMEIPVDGTAMR